MEENYKKGTTTIGILCKDGVVLAADKRASMGLMIGNRNVDKVHKVTDNIVITIAGLVSDAQLITKLLRAELKLKKLRTHKDASVKEAANLLANIQYGNIRKFSAVPAIVGFLLGGKDSQGYNLYDVGVDGSVLEAEGFVSTGSGSTLAIGVLETLYEKDMAIQDGIKLAMKALNAAIQRDMPTGDGMDIYTITEKGAEKVMTKKIVKVAQ
tara:strand:- start:9127 stop:9759 length:633 start_codon:yes stop_codon:yes gene_type:complete